MKKEIRIHKYNFLDLVRKNYHRIGLYNYSGAYSIKIIQLIESFADKKGYVDVVNDFLSILSSYHNIDEDIMNASTYERLTGEEVEDEYDIEGNEYIFYKDDEEEDEEEDE